MINIVIPTLDRYESLMKTLGSVNRISHCRNFKVTVVVDGNRPFRKRLGLQILKNTTLLWNPTRIGWGKSINMVLQLTDDDYYFTASDDLEFLPGTLALALEAMKEKFPDGDGVIGINQNLKHFCPGAFVLVGRKFINRFPDRQLYNPAYNHFCVDSELWHYAESELKFFFCKKALVIHRRYQDDCHRLAQSTLRADRQIWWEKKGKPERYWPKMKVVKNGKKQVV